MTGYTLKTLAGFWWRFLPLCPPLTPPLVRLSLRLLSASSTGGGVPNPLIFRRLADKSFSGSPPQSPADLNNLFLFTLKFTTFVGFDSEPE